MQGEMSQIFPLGDTVGAGLVMTRPVCATRLWHRDTQVGMPLQDPPLLQVLTESKNALANRSIGKMAAIMRIAAISQSVERPSRAHAGGYGGGPPLRNT